MGLPWLKTSAKAFSTFRGVRNVSYARPLIRAYPQGVFYVSNTSGAPNQAPLSRVYPTGKNQATDPRGNNATLFRIKVDDSVANLIAAGTPGNGSGLTGGSNIGNSNITNNIDASPYILWGVLAILAYFIFFRA